VPHLCIALELIWEMH